MRTNVYRSAGAHASAPGRLQAARRNSGVRSYGRGPEIAQFRFDADQSATNCRRTNPAGRTSLRARCRSRRPTTQSTPPPRMPNGLRVTARETAGDIERGPVARHGCVGARAPAPAASEKWPVGPRQKPCSNNVRSERRGRCASPPRSDRRRQWRVLKSEAEVDNRAFGSTLFIEVLA